MQETNFKFLITYKWMEGGGGEGAAWQVEINLSVWHMCMSPYVLAHLSAFLVSLTHAANHILSNLTFSHYYWCVFMPHFCVGMLWTVLHKGMHSMAELLLNIVVK